MYVPLPHSLPYHEATTLTFYPQRAWKSSGADDQRQSQRNKKHGTAQRPPRARYVSRTVFSFPVTICPVDCIAIVGRVCP